MRLLAMSDEIASPISEIRLRTPLKALAAQLGWQIVLRSFYDCRPSDLAAAEVVIVQRGSSRRSVRLQERALAAGATVVYEIDDLLTEIAPHLSQHDAVRLRLPWLRRSLAQADLVTASTVRLQREMEPLARAVSVVPNYAFADGAELPLPPQRPDQPVHLLVASSDRLLEGDFVATLRDVVGEGARLVVVGPPAEDLARLGLPLEGHPLLPRRDFVALARALPNAVAVIPLEASRFAACKSAVKWFDYAEAGVPTIASAVPPYVDAIEHGTSGALVGNDKGQWLQALRTAIDDAEWRRCVAARARVVVRERHTLGQAVTAWHAALLRARQLHHARGVPAPQGPDAWWLAACDAAGELGVTLRQWNRARRARRRAPGPSDRPRG